MAGPPPAEVGIPSARGRGRTITRKIPMNSARHAAPVRHGSHRGGHPPRQKWPIVIVVVAVLTIGTLVVLFVQLGPRALSNLEPAFRARATSTSAPLALPTSVTEGSGPIGSHAWTVPKDALYVSPKGNDSSDGSRAHPFLTVQNALSAARPGQTIVLRGGTYNQRVTVLPGRPVTIEPYPHEKVWFDGSVAVSNWQSDGAIWVSNGWTAQFDDSPTFTSGAAPSTLPDFAFVSSNYPLASDRRQTTHAGRDAVRGQAGHIRGRLRDEPALHRLGSARARGSREQQVEGLRPSGDRHGAARDWGARLRDIAPPVRCDFR